MKSICLSLASPFLFFLACNGSPKGLPDLATDLQGPLVDLAVKDPGRFAQLPMRRGDLISFASELPHPMAGAYIPLSMERQTKFLRFWGMLHETLEGFRDKSMQGEYCTLLGLAKEAEYELSRYYDNVTQRWFLFGQDLRADGQAYFFVNPEPPRDLVIEVPHEPYDQGTARQGARLFVSLGARALLLNQEHRCSSDTTTPCPPTTGACNNRVRISDVAHAVDNTFHQMHVYYNDRSPSTRFAQIHGMVGGPNDMAEISDASLADLDPLSVSVTFAKNLQKHVPLPSAVHSCQAAAGDPPSAFCAGSNTQGRYSNQSTSACMKGAAKGSGRFLHIEQHASLRDADEGDGWSWTDIRDALSETWESCNGSCTLGDPQPVWKEESCPLG